MTRAMESVGRTWGEANPDNTADEQAGMGVSRRTCRKLLKGGGNVAKIPKTTLTGGILCKT